MQIHLSVICLKMEGGGDAKLAEARNHVRKILTEIDFIIIMTTIIIYSVASQVEEVAGIMRDNMEKVASILAMMVTMMTLMKLM